jgi:hypothetical protein
MGLSVWALGVWRETSQEQISKLIFEISEVGADSCLTNESAWEKVSPSVMVRRRSESIDQAGKQSKNDDELRMS